MVDWSWTRLTRLWRWHYVQQFQSHVRRVHSQYVWSTRSDWPCPLVHWRSQLTCSRWVDRRSTCELCRQQAVTHALLDCSFTPLTRTSPAPAGTNTPYQSCRSVDIHVVSRHQGITYNVPFSGTHITMPHNVIGRSKGFTVCKPCDCEEPTLAVEYLHMRIANSSSAGSGCALVVQGFSDILRI